MTRGALTFVVTPVGAVLLYFLIADAGGWGEAVGCLITLAIAVPYAFAVGQTRSVPMLLTARGAFTVVRSFGQVPVQLWRVGLVLGKALVRRPEEMEGSVRSVPFRLGAFDAEDVGRRAAVGTGLSLAPNGFVLGMEHEGDELLIHQLAEAPIGGDRDWPG